MAVLVEKVTDCEFQFLANAYSNQDQTAWALGCDKRETGNRMARIGEGDGSSRRSSTPHPAKKSSSPVMMWTSPACRCSCTTTATAMPTTNDNLVVTKPGHRGHDWGIYRSMFRTKNEKMFDMTCSSHRARINAKAAMARARTSTWRSFWADRSSTRSPPSARRASTVDDFEVLGSFYGHPAKLVRCRTIDLLVPANAEIVIECELMATEGPHP